MSCLLALSMILSAWALPPDEQKVTLDLKNVPMETFLNTVKEKTGISMLYNSQMFQETPSVTVKATNEPWNSLLNRVLTPRGFTYATKDGIVVIKKEEKKSHTLSGKVVDEAGSELPGVTVLILGKEYRYDDRCRRSFLLRASEQECDYTYLFCRHAAVGNQRREAEFG